MSDDELRERVAERIEVHAREHWTEFAVIIASANVLLASVLVGAALSSGQPLLAHVLGVAIADRIMRGGNVGLLQHRGWLVHRLRPFGG